MMNTILRTDVFDRWLSRLKDPRAKARIIKRIRSAERGNLGDCKPVGAGISEMRIHFGPGYRRNGQVIQRDVNHGQIKQIKPGTI